MWKLKLLLVLLVSSCISSVLLYSCQDRDIEEHRLMQQILLAVCGGFSQQRSFVSLGRSVSATFGLWIGDSQLQQCALQLAAFSVACKIKGVHNKHEHVAGIMERREVMDLMHKAKELEQISPPVC